MGRDIQDILCFRQDISPFLAHMTRLNKSISADSVLRKIITDRTLIAGEAAISDARLFINDEAIKRQFCRAISLTETPLNEIHCLLDVSGRSVELEPYGLVFLKANLQKKGVAPVFYLNNELDDQMAVMESLCKLIDRDSRAAERILPLISSFGEKLISTGRVDFFWEREWRYPSVLGNLAFSPEDVFVGICPDEEIDDFEREFSDIKFVDCRRNMKWYATKLVEARRVHGLKCSVV
jgi:hypothetical protein